MPFFVVLEQGIYQVLYLLLIGIAKVDIFLGLKVILLCYRKKYSYRTHHIAHQIDFFAFREALEQVIKIYFAINFAQRKLRSLSTFLQLLEDIYKCFSKVPFQRCWLYL